MKLYDTPGLSQFISGGPPHRHIREKARTKVRAFFSSQRQGGMRSPDRGSTTGAASWTDHERSEWAARRASAASQSPPHRHLLQRSLHASAGFFVYSPILGGMRSPDRGSTTGKASWTDHEHSEWAARRASAASQSPRTQQHPTRKYHLSALQFPVPWPDQRSAIRPFHQMHRDYCRMAAKTPYSGYFVQALCRARRGAGFRAAPLFVDKII